MCSIFIVRQMFFQAVHFKEFRRNYLRNELAMLLPFSVLVFFLAMLLIILEHQFLSNDAIHYLILQEPRSFRTWRIISFGICLNIYYLQSFLVFFCPFLYQFKFNFHVLYILVSSSPIPGYFRLKIWKIKGCILPLESTL